MKINIRRVIAFFLLILLSVGFGFAYDGIATAIERHRHPRPEKQVDEVAEYAAEYGIPEPVIWAILKTQSNFTSNAVSEQGAIGLMQLTPKQFDFICTRLLGIQTPDAGMLYDPETNLRCGCAWLSYLYARYDTWHLAFAAYRNGTEILDAWLTDSTLVDQNGMLPAFPDSETTAFVENIERTVEKYSQLYYES